MENQREEAIRRWFAMWLEKKDRGIAELFDKDEAFDGVSLVSWTAEGRIARLKEFGCNTGLYDPYEGGPVPRFQEKGHPWF